MKYIKSDSLKEESKINPKDFTRERKINFFKLVMIVLCMCKRTSQIELDQTLKNYGFRKTIDMTYTKQAFSESRQKLSEKAFILLNQNFMKEYYSDGDFKRYRKYILMAIDGCVHEIPDTFELQEKYGFSTNGKKDFRIARALTSSLYDVENKFLVCSVFARYDSSERDNARFIIDEALTLIPANEEILITFDRGYPAMEFIEYLKSVNVHYLMRVSSSFCKEVISTESNDEWVELEITKERAKNLKKQGAILSEGTKIRVRVIKVVLDTGEIEVLITDLDEDELPYEDAKELYFKRWGIETKFDELKNKFQIENYTGEKPIIIEQDYYSTMFLSNLASLLERDAEEISNDRRAGKTLKYTEYRINRSILVGKIKCDFFKIMLEKDNLIKEAMYLQMINEISRNVVPYIENKKTSRNKPKIKGNANKYSRARKRSF
jgi:hypothetical protein